MCAVSFANAAAPVFSVWRVDPAARDRSGGNCRQTQYPVQLVVDHGIKDVGIAGSKFYDTPNIDALARGGMRFAQGQPIWFLMVARDLGQEFVGSDANGCC